MPWFRVDDKLHDHVKTRRAGKSAMGVWALAGSWCMDHLTDGFVPANVLPRWGTTGDAKKLVEAGLWHAGEHNDERGWWFHNWTEFQPSKAQVEVERAYNRRKTELLRDKDLVAAIRKRDGDRCRYCGTLVNWSDRRGATGATYDHVDPKGPNSLDNVVVACRACNGGKSGRTPEEWGRPLLAPGSMGTKSGSSSVPSTNLDPIPDPTQSLSLVTSSRHLTVIPGEQATTIDLEAIRRATGGDASHAQAVADEVLSRAHGPQIQNPTAYVLRAVGAEPERYKPTARNPRKDELCPQPGHSGWAGSCIQCAADGKAAR